MRWSTRSSNPPVMRLARTVIIAVATLIAGWIGVQKTSTPQAPAANVSDGKMYRVIRAIDGDTIKLDNGEHVRLIGIDTPESHDNPKLERDVQKKGQSKETILRLGRKAASYSQQLLNDQEVRLEFDVQPRDRYQRLLAYVYLADGTFLNQKIIQDGYAYPLTIPPNVKHAREFKQWFEEARSNKRGLWQ